jgi:hypothetical protein
MTELADGLPPSNDYVTDARIIVKRGMQGEPPQSGWFIMADADVGASEVHRQVTGIAYDRDLKIFHPFVARQSYLDYEWGGSARAVEVVLEVIDSVTDEAVGAAIGLALERIVKNVTDRITRRTREPLTVEAADVQARLAIRDCYGREGNKLKRIREDHADECITLTYRFKRKETFTAEVSRYRRGSQVTHVTRLDTR